MSLFGALSTAGSGIALVNRQLAQTSQNISAADIAGATRKRVVATQAIAGGDGIGVFAKGVMRADDPALRLNMLRAVADFGFADRRATLLAPIDGILGRPEDADSLAGLVERLKRSFVDLRADPSDTVLQLAVLDRAETLAQGLNRIADAIQRARQNAHDALRGMVDEGNRLLGELGRLDARIVALKTTGVPVAELEDERDRIVARLGEQFGFRAIVQATGTVLIATRNGVIVPKEDTALSLAAASIGPDAYYEPGPPADPIPALLVSAGNASFELDTSHLGGAAGAAMTIRDSTLPVMQAECDELAHKLAHRFAAQGLPLFTRPDGTLPPTSPPQAYAGFANAIVVNPQVVATPSAVRDGLPSLNTFSNPAFPDVIEAVLDTVFGAVSSPFVFQSVNLGPNADLISPVAVTSTTSLFAYASAIGARHAAVFAEAAAEQTKAADTKALAERKLAERVGISLDDEMALLIRLQNAYAANARVIATVQSMFDALLVAVR